jgi:threonylcarbamoyladenosine tRNA methylthiotransferase MtaB
MLRAMRRPYLPADYCELTTRIRRVLPDASIGSDVIVGFPGETELHFAEMCDVLERLPLTYLHVFPYSDRPGTPAARMPQKVDGGTIRERGRQVRAIGARMAAAFRHSQVGRERRALTVDDGTWAVTDNYLKVRLEAQHPRNVWVRVRL